MEEKTTPLVHNNWDPLEEIWLGDVYPEHFYDDLEPDIRDSFKLLTQWTKEDLDTIQKKFEEFNVKVVRPLIDDDVSLYQYTLNGETTVLSKPPICPRNTNAVVGDKLFSSENNNHAYSELLKNYNNLYIAGPNIPEVGGANMVKLGKDIIFDFSIEENKEVVFEHFYQFQKLHGSFFSEYRLHYSTNGGHCDGCFMPVKPGLVLTTEYWKDYKETLPGWKRIPIKHPSYITAGKEFKENGENGHWLGFLRDLPPHFNKFVHNKCKDWIGNYKETYFEVNIIMIDENNMICFDSAKANEPIYEVLDKHGVRCHIVPWRTRGFWDGGLHCITLDVKRKAKLEDYFPSRGNSGINPLISTTIFKNHKDFFSEFNDWLDRKVN